MFSKSFGNLKDLKRLFVGDNRWTSIPDVFKDLAGLEELYLENNCLTSLPSWLNQLPGLGVLDLSDNILASIPEKLKWLVNCNVYLDGNPLATIDIDILRQMENQGCLISWR
ncbi:MAG: leucine-rich repeat domain-containing protein [Candidatus Hodarchaeales archaeon]